MTAPARTPIGIRAPVLGPGLLFGVLLAAVLVRGRLGALDAEDLRLWSTLFVSICVQALPFLALGVVISGAIAAFLPPDLVRRLVPRNPLLAVPAAGVAGLALPGCECGSVPIAGRLISTGTPPAAALTFLLAAPAINPVVLVSTAVAFPGDPEMVWARFGASLTAAMVVGWWWARRGDTDLLACAVHHDHGHEHGPDPDAAASSVGGGRRIVTRRSLGVFADTASRDLVHAGGYLVVGALAAATLQLVVPRAALDAVADNELASILALALLAVVLSICSEADAFVAAGLPQFSLSSRLVFLVVGPVVDLKLVALQSGILGRGFAARFAPVSFVVAVGCAVVAGMVLL